MAIPKKIHYCWFGRGQMPEFAIRCMNSWKKHLPDYEMILWDEDTFDINSNRYVKEAYESKKYAFVSDYVRLHSLYYHGGIYMDTDIEVLKSLDKFLEHRAFTGCESPEFCVTGIMAAERGHKWIKELLGYYKNKGFILNDGTYNTNTNTQTITEITKEKFGWKSEDSHQLLIEGLNIYPSEVFCPKDYKTGQIFANENTYTIHHFSGSWLPRTSKIKRKIKNSIGPRGVKFIVKVKEKVMGKSY